MRTHLDACEFFLSLRDPRELVDMVESLRVSDSAPCTPYRTIDNGFIPMLKIFNKQFPKLNQYFK